MQPLEGLDAAFLSLETPTTPLHVGAVMILDPPEGARSLFSPSSRFTQIRRVIAQRVHLVEPFRQRALRVPFGLHHPVWVDDPEFELDDHVSRASLPSPGGPAELDAFVATTMSRPLDQDRPLWEMYVVEGLAGDRTALVAKVHHAILDGVSGASMLAAFLDLSPRERLVERPFGTWAPGPLPGSTQMLRYAATSLAQQPAHALNTLNAGVEAIADLGQHNRELASRGEPSPPAFFSAPRTSLNGTVSNRKRFSSLSIPLEDVKLIRHAFGGTVNDVILAGVAGGLQRVLGERGEAVARPLVAMVPVSTRAAGEAEDGALGNQISAMLVSLATDEEDPVRRLAAIAASTRVAKEQEQLHRGRLVGNLAQMAAPGMVSRLARAVSGIKMFDWVSPPFNVMVSGVKGPDFSLFCAGSRVAALYPVGPLTEGVGLNVTILSYLDQLHFGLLACRRLLPELDQLAVSIDDALGELAGCALDARGAVS
jgi:diacylglycerol O-acyltransferase / wax synthase